MTLTLINYIVLLCLLQQWFYWLCPDGNPGFANSIDSVGLSAMADILGAKYCCLTKV